MIKYIITFIEDYKKCGGKRDIIKKRRLSRTHRDREVKRLRKMFRELKSTTNKNIVIARIKKLINQKLPDLDNE